MRRWVLILLLGLLAGCQTDPTSMFERHVLSPIPQEVTDIKYHKDRSAMHGPMFFRFQADKVQVEAIIRKHNLTALTTDLPVVQTLNRLAHKKAQWWTPSEDMDKYFVWYDPKSGIGDWHLRVVYYDGQIAYMITSGFFDPDKYVVNRSPL